MPYLTSFVQLVNFVTMKMSQLCVKSLARGQRYYGLRMSSSAAASRNVVIVDGVRIPFTMAGTVYSDYLAVDLQRMALKGLLTKTALDPELLDYMYCGTVIQETRTSNIA